LDGTTDRSHPDTLPPGRQGSLSSGAAECCDHRMTASTPLPVGVQRVIDATNSSDRAAFLAAFTPDGVVDDWGHTFTGRAKISAWDDRENIGAGAYFQVQQVSMDGSTCTVELTVSGQGYNGPSTFVFELDGPLIRRMTITA
jgi:hypothetical protein